MPELLSAESIVVLFIDSFERGPRPGYGGYGRGIAFSHNRRFVEEKCTRSQSHLSR